MNFMTPKIARKNFMTPEIFQYYFMTLKKETKDCYETEQLETLSNYHNVEIGILCRYFTDSDHKTEV